MMPLLNIANIVEATEAEGPGLRFVVWVQGCLKRCQGCCNPELLKIKPTHIFSSKEIIEHLEGFVQKAKELASGDIGHIASRGVILPENSEDELKEASTHISLFVQKVNLAMSESEEALKKAENAVSQLQDLAEEVEEAIADMGIDENEKRKFDKNVNATEDIAIQSAENLIHVTKMLQKLKKSLNAMVESSTQEKKEG